MTWVITGSEKTPVDPQFGSVSLLLHGNGANGSTTFTDSSSSPKTVTAVGNAQISTAQSKFGGSSIAFDGTGDYLTISSANDLIVGGTWTIEGHLWTSSIKERFTFVSTAEANQVGGLHVFLDANPNVIVRISGTGADCTFPRPPDNTWNHVAIVSSSRTISAFVNGARQFLTLVDRAITQPITIVGRLGSNSLYDLNGYIDDLRITKGVARYTANFTPPTAPFPDI